MIRVQGKSDGGIFTLTIRDDERGEMHVSIAEAMFTSKEWGPAKGRVARALEAFGYELASALNAMRGKSKDSPVGPN